MAALTERFPEQTAFFVLGAILGGIPVIWKASTIRRPSVSSFLWLAAGILMVVALSFLPKNLFDGGEASLLGFVIQFIAGILGALALVLPGISFSSMLYMMGVYNFIFSSIAFCTKAPSLNHRIRSSHSLRTGICSIKTP